MFCWQYKWMSFFIFVSTLHSCSWCSVWVPDRCCFLNVQCLFFRSRGKARQPNSKILGFLLVLLSAGSWECSLVAFLFFTKNINWFFISLGIQCPVLGLNWCAIFFLYITNGSNYISPLLSLCLLTLAQSFFQWRWESWFQSIWSSDFWSYGGVY